MGSLSISYYMYVYFIRQEGVRVKKLSMLIQLL